MPDTHPSAGDTIPPNCQLIEVRVARAEAALQRDRSVAVPRKRSRSQRRGVHRRLGPRSARAGPARSARVSGSTAGIPEEPAMLRDAVHEFFSHKRASMRGRSCASSFAVGRTSLLIGVICLGASIAIGNLERGRSATALLATSCARAC